MNIEKSVFNEQHKETVVVALKIIKKLDY